MQARKGRPAMSGDMDAVVDKIMAKLNRESSVTEVPWAICAKFLGFLWDSAAHNFEIRCLALAGAQGSQSLAGRHGKACLSDA